jgi:hypothetical protein
MWRLGASFAARLSGAGSPAGVRDFRMIEEALPSFPGRSETARLAEALDRGPGRGLTAPIARATS